MPVHLHADGFTVTDHREHAIAIIHNQHRDDCAEFHDHETDCPVKHDDQPVTLADLLDLSGAAEADGDDSPKWTEVSDAYDRANDATKLVYARILLAIEGDIDAGDLSPEERAEFDRRTT